jgi:hypothetical protein
VKKYLLTLILLVTLVLSACGGGNNTAEDTEPILVQPEDEPTADLAGTGSTSNAPATCTAVSAPYEETVGEGDWVEGAEEGYTVTLVEYGDFQ